MTSGSAHEADIMAIFSEFGRFTLESGPISCRGVLAGCDPLWKFPKSPAKADESDRKGSPRI